jgi:uncharacterized protein YacL
LLIELLRLIVVLGAVVGANRLASSRPSLFGTSRTETVVFLTTALGAGIGYLVGGVIARGVDRLMKGAEEHLARRHVSEILAATVGAIVGGAAAALVSWPLIVFAPLWIAAPAAAFVGCVVIAFAIRFGVRKRLEIFGVLGVAPTPAGLTGGCLLDASAAIDGRVLALYRAGLLPLPLCVPSFILWELQGIADSQDPMRRRRGQRGLDVLTSLREAGAEVRVLDEDPAATTEPDVKLVIVARRRGLPIVTSDSNLARAAELQGVGVLNLHGLAELLRPPVLPGELARVRLVKPGRESGQGIGYLDDGTMVVVERAKHLLGEEVSVEVTSVLQNDSGRMLFAKTRDSPDGAKRLPPESEPPSLREVT